VNWISQWYDFFVEYRSDHDTRPDQFEREHGIPPRWSLFIIAVLSFGLWWVIWLAVSKLASAFSG
jgi:hypothetical protein